MRKTMLGVLTVSALGLGFAVAPATASPGSTFAGGCGIASALGARRGQQLFSATVVYSDNQADNPVSADVTCTVSVNGVVRQTATFSGTTAVVGAVPSTYPQGLLDETVEICTTVDYTSNADPSSTTCTAVSDPIATVDSITSSTIILDTVICPALSALAPGVPGVVDIDSTGDTTVAGTPFWDCPPYQTV